MLDAPSMPEPGQYEELGLRFVGVPQRTRRRRDRDGATRRRLAAIGDTPVVRLDRLVEPGMAEVWVKLESYNPTGSYKDRMALAMIEGAERSGRLSPGQTRRRVHRRLDRELARVRLLDQGLPAADRQLGRLRRREDQDDAGVRR